MRVPRFRFHRLQGEGLEGCLALRTRKHVLGAERTVLVTYNPELFLAQSSTLLREIRKRTRKLRELRMRLAHFPAKGKTPRLDSVHQQVQEILSGRHMKDLINVKVYQKGGAAASELSGAGERLAASATDAAGQKSPLHRPKRVERRRHRARVSGSVPY